MFRNLHSNEKQLIQCDGHSTIRTWVSGSIAVTLYMTLIAGLISSQTASPSLKHLVYESLSLSGVENPVTAVLLNFRSYDTLLEIAALFSVVLAVKACLPKQDTAAACSQTGISTSPVLAHVLRALVPLIIIVSGYLLWTGAYNPGGAFQAAALIAGAAVLLSLSGYHFLNNNQFRPLLVAGTAVFLLAAVIVSFFTGLILQYPVSLAAPIILGIEIVATVSIAATLFVFYSQLNEPDHSSSQCHREAGP